MSDEQQNGDQTPKQADESAPTVEEIARALAIVESNDNSNVPLGDGGRALGRWQVHPDRLFDEAKRFELTPHLGETWDSFVGRVLRAMIAHELQNWTPIEVAMFWHLGHRLHEGEGDWDHAYGDKFSNDLVHVIEFP